MLVTEPVSRDFTEISGSFYVGIPKDWVKDMQERLKAKTAEEIKLRLVYNNGVITIIPAKILLKEIKA